MEQSQTWTEHFGISQELFAQWQASETNTPFLSWCLKNGAINETQYMQWASARYELPIVKDSFFALPTAEQNWTTGKFLYQWNQTILPLEDWDGIVRVACSEPPTQFQLSQPHVFVLASPRQLETLWHRFFQDAPLQSPVVAPVSDTFDPSALLAAYNEHADAIESAESVELAAAAEAEAFVMPEGFVTASPDLVIPMPTFKKPLAATPAAAVEPQLVTPQPAPVLFSDELTPLPESFATPPVQAPLVAASAPETTPPSMGAAGDFVAPVLPTAPSDFDLCESIEEVVACAFTKMSTHFQYNLALLPSGETLSPWLWSGKFTRDVPTERPSSIDLTTPSFFRIVMRTSMPYHGLTRPSEVNDRFFKEWTQGAALAHVTVAPIMMDDHIAVLLFGGMDNVIEPRAALSDMEHWTRSAALACRRISEKAASVAA